MMRKPLETEVKITTTMKRQEAIIDPDSRRDETRLLSVIEPGPTPVPAERGGGDDWLALSSGAGEKRIVVLRLVSLEHFSCTFMYLRRDLTAC